MLDAFKKNIYKYILFNRWDQIGIIVQTFYRQLWLNLYKVTMTVTIEETTSGVVSLHPFKIIL